MNEFDWLTCEDAGALLRYLYENQTQLHSICRPLLPDMKGDRFNVLPSHFIREVVGNPFRVWCHCCGKTLSDRDGNLCKGCNHIVCTDCCETYDHFQNDGHRIPYLTPSIRDFAQNIIESGDYVDVDGLADRLEEAGCDNEEILRHLRGEVRCPYDHIGNRRVDGDPAFSPNVCECGGNGWLHKPAPCQPGCWVLRLLTEFQRVDV